MVKEFGGRARFVAENYGDSQLARRFGVKRYPAIFVDDVLVATPKDFGFYGAAEGGGGGRYASFPSAAGEERFRSDLAQMIALVLAGRKDAARQRSSPIAAGGIAALPALDLVAIDGRRVTRRDLLGQVVVMDLWATWCPPCRSTLPWLGEVKKLYGGRLAVLAVAAESDEAQVRQLAGGLRLPFVWAMGTPALFRSLGDLTALPTLLLFDRDGSTAATFYGAPPGLHAEVETKLASLLADRR